MNLKLCAVIVAMAFLAGFCLAASKPVTDNYIIDMVRIKLSGDPEVKGGALEVNSVQGVVTLTGSVETQHQKDKAAKLAKKVKGVKQVVNNLVLKDRNAGK